MNASRYGIFKLGQIWTLTDPGGARLGFPSREIAIAALQTMIAVRGADDGPVVVTLQEENGQLRTLLGPGADLLREGRAKRSPWDALFPPEPTRPSCLRAASEGATNDDAGQRM